MNNEELLKEIGNIDLYLLDQILKERYSKNDIILDAGCGNGRNLKWFYHQKYTIWAVDKSKKRIKNIKDQYPLISYNCYKAELQDLPFENNFFDHIICSAVLHFAKNDNDFTAMFEELTRVLKPEGTMFIRTASTIGVEHKMIHINNGVYELGDSSERFLISKEHVRRMVKSYGFNFLEPIKTVNVDDIRAMTTLVLRKN